MHTHGDEPHQRGPQGKTSSLQERIAHFYYAYGLFCGTYSATLVFVAICVTLLSCYPLINLPLPGNSPLQTWTSVINSSSTIQPFCYIQQVVLKTAVLPWGPELNLADGFRAPLYEAFKLLETIRNYQDSASFKTLGHVCLHVESIRRHKETYKNILPEYSCLVLSPANLWWQDVSRFSQDNSLLTTIFNHHNFQKGKTSITEMMFGMKVFDTGIKRYPLRNRYRIIQYAVTLFLKEYDKEFINGLNLKLQSIYPLYQTLQQDTSSIITSNDTLVIHYPEEINVIEFLPITCSFLILFLYFYFYFRKIELIYSKFGMAVTSVTTLIASLTMTYGLCFFFGLTLNLEGKIVFPYLVLLVGLENVLCLTKSIVSSPLHLDVKIRIAQGLSKEGWSITKNLLLEITILTFGIFTFVAVIQEFCIFAVVGLVTDYFMQMVFFSTVLSIDIRRKDSVVEKNNFSFRSRLYQRQTFYDGSVRDNGMQRSKSHPRLTSFPANIVAGQAQGAQEKRIPKRLKLVNIWTRTRFFHRCFMILMIIWISNIAYSNGFIEHYILNNSYLYNNREEQTNVDIEQNYSSIRLFPLLNTSNSFVDRVTYITQNPLSYKYPQNHTFEFENLRHSNYAPWHKLSPQHWVSIVRKYNLSLSGQILAILPNIKISHVVTPDEAIVLRNPSEKYGEKFQWQALAAALDPIDFNGMETGTGKVTFSEQPFYPTSVFAMILIAILCFISVVVLGYTLIVFYRCICSRNYAEWRSSWFSSDKNEENADDTVLLEAVPIVLEAHHQEIECIATDGVNLTSCSLDGQLNVWDGSTGELLFNVDRKSHFRDIDDISDSTSEYDDDNSSDYESGSPPSRAEMYVFPGLKQRINTNFSNKPNSLKCNSYNAKADFNKTYRELYFNRHMHKSKRKLKNITKTKEDKLFYFAENFHNDFESVNGVPLEVNDRNVDLNIKLSPIWCMDYMDNLIVIGCANGRLEFWEGSTGRLKCIFEDGTEVGINNLKIVGSKIVVSRLYGTLELFQLQTYSRGHPVDWNFTFAYRRTHVRTGSVGSAPGQSSLISPVPNIEEDFRCLKVFSVKAHQQPIICLDCEGGRILTGSQDHTLKVFRLDDVSLQYTLHGHYGPITCLFIDRVSPTTSGSGSQDGMLCVWDLMSGACMYNIQAHDGVITSLTYSASYVISLGSDDRLCVWERFQGHILNTIYVSQTFSSQVIMLTPHLVVTARNGGLVIWDVKSGECVRSIALGHSPFVFVKQMMLFRDAVFCDYGHQLRIVRFPLISHKFD